MAIVLGISLNAAYGMDDFISINLDKRNYSEGDTISISGNVGEILFGHEVKLMIFSPGDDIIGIEKTTVDSSKNFQLEFDTHSLKDSGEYSILVNYGPEQKIEKSFTFEKNSIETTGNKKNVLLNFDFLNPKTKKIQEHVDYTITILQNGKILFGPTMAHSSTGTISIPIHLVERYPHQVQIDVNEVLFVPIPVESSVFTIVYGSQAIQSEPTSNNSLIVNLALNKDPSPEPKVIPTWVKNTAKWWSSGKIDDTTFVEGIKYLMEEKILDIPDLPYSATWHDKQVPDWVKNTAIWWADDLIHEDDFIKGIKFLVETGVIQINHI